MYIVIYTTPYIYICLSYLFFYISLVQPKAPVLAPLACVGHGRGALLWPHTGQTRLAMTLAGEASGGKPWDGLIFQEEIVEKWWLNRI